MHIVNFEKWCVNQEYEEQKTESHFYQTVQYVHYDIWRKEIKTFA